MSFKHQHAVSYRIELKLDYHGNPQVPHLVVETNLELEVGAMAYDPRAVQDLMVAARAYMHDRKNGIESVEIRGNRKHP